MQRSRLAFPLKGYLMAMTLEWVQAGSQHTQRPNRFDLRLRRSTGFEFYWLDPGCLLACNMFLEVPFA